MYKPQYITTDFNGTVRDFFELNAQQLFISSFYKAEIFEPLNLKYLLDKQLDTLSGGELQRVATANCLVQDVDIFLIDEPSAYLDSQQRMITSRTIRRIMEKSGKVCSGKSTRSVLAVPMTHTTRAECDLLIALAVKGPYSMPVR